MNASPAACLGQRLQAVHLTAIARAVASPSRASRCDRASPSSAARTMARQSFRRTYSRFPSEAITAATASRVHCRASAKTSWTSTARACPRNRVTFAGHSLSAMTSPRHRRNAARALGFRALKLAATRKASTARSTVSGGMASACNVFNAVGITLTPDAPPPEPALTEHGYGQAFKRKGSRTGRATHARYGRAFPHHGVLP